MFHRITIIGFVGQPPQMRYTEDNTAVTNFSVATRQVVSKERVAGCPQGWKESLNGKNWELTTWFRVTCWRKLAEITGQYVKKGTAVFVKGEIDASSFTDREGTARVSLELTASKVQFLGGRDGEGEEGSRGGSDPAENDLPF